MSSTIRATRKFHFDMAHALYGHDGLCRNIHGHTYELHITLSGIPLCAPGNPKDGMVMDFTDLKKIVTSEIIDRYDHALVLNINSPHAKLKDLDIEFGRLVLMDKQPTCENLVIEIVQRLSDRLPAGIKLQNVILWETPTSYCEWRLEDNV